VRGHGIPAEFVAGSHQSYSVYSKYIRKNILILYDL